MMNKSFLAPILLVAFIALAAFGLFVSPMSYSGHRIDCPFSPGVTALCVDPVAHGKHWQDSFLAILIQALIFTGITLLFIRPLWLYPKLDPQYQRYKLQTRIPVRPSLLQELYSQGILNRKAP